MAISLTVLQERVGYHFDNISYLERAVTHSSYSNETGARNHHLLCNERLEFLGDSVLSLVVSNYLYTHFSEYPEGTLTRIRSAVVCEAALASFAEKIGLGEFLLLGKCGPGAEKLRFSRVFAGKHPCGDCPQGCVNQLSTAVTCS